MTTTLHVWTDDTDWIVAETLEDAAAVQTAHYGGTWEDLHGDDPPADVLTMCDDAATLRLRDMYGDGTGYNVKTHAEWAAEFGRGFLASTEF